MKKLSLLLAMLLALTFAFAAHASALELTYGSFTLTLPDDAELDPDDDSWYTLDNAYVSFSYTLYDESTIEETIDFDYDYAHEYHPDCETTLVRATPYVAFMMTDYDEQFIIVFVNYGAEDLSIYVFPGYLQSLSAARRVTTDLLNSIVFDAPDGTHVDATVGAQVSPESAQEAINAAKSTGDSAKSGGLPSDDAADSEAEEEETDLKGALLELAGQGLSLLTELNAQ